MSKVLYLNQTSLDYVSYINIYIISYFDMPDVTESSFNCIFGHLNIYFDVTHMSETSYHHQTFTNCLLLLFDIL